MVSQRSEIPVGQQIVNRVYEEKEYALFLFPNIESRVFIMLRLRLCNRYLIIGCVLFFIGMIISFLLDTSIIQVMWKMGHAAPSADGLNKAQVIQGYQNQIKEIWNANFFTESVLTYTSIIFPLFASITCMHFIVEVHGYFPFAVYRNKKQGSMIWKAILTNSLFSAIALFLTFCLLFLICQFFINYDKNYSSALFDILFGKGFGMHHQIWYILMEAFFKICIFNLVYSIFTCGVYIESNSKLLALLVPVVYFFAFSIMFSNNYFLFAAFPFSITGYVGKTIFQGVLPLFIPLLLGILLSIKGIYEYGHK